MASGAPGLVSRQAGGAILRNEVMNENDLLEAIDPGCTDMTEEPANSDADQYFRAQTKRQEAAKVVANRVKSVTDANNLMLNSSLENMKREFELLSAECLKFRRALIIIRDNHSIDPRKYAKDNLPSPNQTQITNNK